MRISLIAGDLCDAHADALCTSTNPRLSLVMGTGASVRGHGGFQILRECEAIVATDRSRSAGRGLPPGSAHTTSGGQLPSKVVIHCVASDAAHRTSAEIIRNCVTNALAAADAAKCASVAMPLFGTGHARFKVGQALSAIAEALRDAKTRVGHVILVVYDPEHVNDALAVINRVIPDCALDVVRGPSKTNDRGSQWSSRWGSTDEL